MGFPGGSVIRLHLLMQETQGMQVQSLGQEDPLEEELATPLQYSCLENSMDRGSWWVTVHRVAQTWTHNLATEHTHRAELPKCRFFCFVS